MQETLKTTLLEFEKSAYLIDLIKTGDDLLYIQIVQTIFKDKSYKQTIRINPNVLSEIISILEEYKDHIPKKQIKGFRFLPDPQKDKIQERYLKGVSIKDLAMQLDLTEDDIESVLSNRNLPIVPNELPMQRKRRPRRKS